MCMCVRLRMVSFAFGYHFTSSSTYGFVYVLRVVVVTVVLMLVVSRILDRTIVSSMSQPPMIPAIIANANHKSVDHCRISQLTSDEGKTEK